MELLLGKQLNHIYFMNMARQFNYQRQTQDFILHKLAAETFTGPKPPNNTTHHKDEIISNNFTGNLEYKRLP